MAKRKNLKSVAYSFQHSFMSMMNYWEFYIEDLLRLYFYSLFFMNDFVYQKSFNLLNAHEILANPIKKEKNEILL